MRAVFTAGLDGARRDPRAAAAFIAAAEAIHAPKAVGYIPARHRRWA